MKEEPRDDGMLCILTTSMSVSQLSCTVVLQDGTTG